MKRSSLRFASSIFAFALLLTVASYGAETQLKTPEDGATTSLMPKAILNYKSPEERGWETPYKIEDLKNGEKECSKPESVRFEWTWDGLPSATFALQLATKEDFSDAKEYPTENATSVEATNLKIGTTYYWRVATKLPCAAPTFSAVRTFKTDGTLPQWFDVAGISNVRDGGGWKVGADKRVKFGMIYRGTEMDVHLPIQEEGKKYMLEEMGIQTDLDLRGKSEWGGQEDRESPLGPTVRWVNFPVSSYGGIFDDDDKAMYRDIFKMLAKEETYPIYIHCMGGADRCGTLNVAIKALLGVSDDDLARDYEMTSFSVIGERNATAEWYKGLLDGLAKFEGDSVAARFENFIKSTGVSQEEIDAIRALLIENVQ